MANWTSVKLSDLMRQKTLRMDAKYWIQKALLKKRKKELEKKKAWALVSEPKDWISESQDIGGTASETRGQVETDSDLAKLEPWSKRWWFVSDQLNRPTANW